MSQGALNTITEIESLAKQATVEAARQLAILAKSPDTRLAKAARTALYRLKERGVSPPDVPASPNGSPASTPANRISERPKTRAKRAWMSTVGMSGERFIAIELDTRRGTHTLLAFVGDDVSGIGSMRRISATTDDLDQMLSRIREKAYECAPIPIEFAVASLEALSQRNAVSRRLLPMGFRIALDSVDLPLTTDGASHPVYAWWSEEEMRSADGPPAPKPLLDHAVAQRWFLESAEAEWWADKIEEISASGLILTEAQTRARFTAVLDEATDAAYPLEAIKRERRRLEDTALVVAESGDSELARTILVQAVHLDSARPAHELLFLRALVEATITLVLDLREERRRFEVRETTP